MYRRHTNFSQESISNTFNGAAGFGRSVVAQISRNGDLIHRVYLQVDLPALTSNSVEWVAFPGLRLLKYVEIEIGGQRIDKHYSDWMYIWNELSLPKGKVDGYSTMVGNDLATVYGASTATPATTLYIPLEFWFCRNVGLALNDRAEKHPPSCTKCMQEENMSYGYTNTFAPKMLVSAY